MIMAVRPVMPAGEQVEAAKTGVMVRAASVKRTGMVMANTFLMKPRIRAPDLSLLPSSIDTIIHLWITLRYSRVSRLGNWILRKSGKPVRESRETMTLVKMEKKQRVGVRCSLRVPRGCFILLAPRETHASHVLRVVRTFPLFQDSFSVRQGSGRFSPFLAWNQPRTIFSYPWF